MFKLFFSTDFSVASKHTAHEFYIFFANMSLREEPIPSHCDEIHLPTILNPSISSFFSTSTFCNMTGMHIRRTVVHRGVTNLTSKYISKVEVAVWSKWKWHSIRIMHFKYQWLEDMTQFKRFWGFFYRQTEGLTDGLLVKCGEQNVDCKQKLKIKHGHPARYRLPLFYTSSSVK